jgi:sigma-E factor negative regulatory protein RseC
MIQHTGKILSVEKNIAEISLQKTSACAACHAKSACISADNKERLITAKIDPKEYSIGEEVQVNLKTGQGYKAVLLAYVIPFLIILSVLIAGEAMILPEWQSGLLSLAIAALYFGVLKLFGEKMTNTMTFEVEKITNT